MKRLWNGLQEHPGPPVWILLTLMWLACAGGDFLATMAALAMSGMCLMIILITAYQNGEDV